MTGFFLDSHILKNLRKMLTYEGELTFHRDRWAFTASG